MLDARSRRHSTPLADLGAEVIKVEPPGGDYGRKMTWPIVEGTSLLFLDVSRGKRSVTLDLRTEAARQVFLDLARDVDVVVEAMRPGGLERRGLGPDVLRGQNPGLVFCTISGYGSTGPYRDLPSHGIAYDTWAGIVDPDRDDLGRPSLPVHTSIGISAGPLYGVVAILAAVIAGSSGAGDGTDIEVVQFDAAAAFDWSADRDRACVRAACLGGDRKCLRRRRAPTARRCRHGRQRALSDLRRPRNAPGDLHGVRAPFLAEVL